MSRKDGESYELNGHVIPSLRAIREANKWFESMGVYRAYDVSEYYDVESCEEP